MDHDCDSDSVCSSSSEDSIDGSSNDREIYDEEVVEDEEESELILVPRRKVKFIEKSEHRILQLWTYFYPPE